MNSSDASAAVQPDFLTPDTLRLWLDRLPNETLHVRCWALLSLRQYLFKGRFIVPGQKDAAPIHDVADQTSALARDAQVQWAAVLAALPRDLQRDLQAIDRLGPTVHGIELGGSLMAVLVVTVFTAHLPVIRQDDALYIALLSGGSLLALIAGWARTHRAARAARRHGGIFTLGLPVWSPMAAQSLQRALDLS